MKLVFATNNSHKIQEVQTQLPDYITLADLATIGCVEELPETAATIAGNAIQKARYIKNKYGFDCFADDTGLEVVTLNGEPGVYSARYAGPQKNDEDNIQLLLKKMDGITNRKARFVTVIALCVENDIVLFEGECVGEITNEKQGNEGFGYDSIFKPKGYEITFAEMSVELKNKIGHRGNAVRKLINYLYS